MNNYNVLVYGNYSYFLYNLNDESFVINKDKLESG